MEGLHALESLDLSTGELGPRRAGHGDGLGALDEHAQPQRHSEQWLAGFEVLGGEETAPVRAVRHV